MDRMGTEGVDVADGAVAMVRPQMLQTIVFFFSK